jgi:Tol biopolymer transport system component
MRRFEVPTQRPSLQVVAQPGRLLTALTTFVLALGFVAPALNPASGAYPGANGLIAFHSDRDGNQEIYVMQADGTGQTRLTTNGATDSAPAWSPDGTRIAFRSSRDGNSEIYVMNADGTDPARLTTDPGSDTEPTWSPDGTRIAFHSNRHRTETDQNFEIYVINADGSGETRLTTDVASDSHPVWSPDGTKIAFWTNRDGNSEIYVMNVDGTNPVNVSMNPAEDTGPAWSPDASKIAFASDRDASIDIWVMNADGSQPTRVTTDPAADVFPAWSPDGSQITFHSFRDENSDIYTMNADGAGQTRRTVNAALDELPDWQPASSATVGAVSADVTVAASAACLELSTTSVSFGTLPLGSTNAPATPGIDVSNCSAEPETMLARGTDATGTNASWTLTDAAATCETTLGLDAYRLGLDPGPLGSLVQLSADNKTLSDAAAPGAVLSNTAVIDTACSGSSGAGTTMTMQIVFVATD